MKKLFSLFLICMMVSIVMAQPGSGKPQPNTPNAPHNPTPPPHQNPMSPMNRTVTLSSDHGELFHVYVDGDIVNRQPMNSVVVNDLSPKPHDLYVVLKRPVDKIMMMNYTPSMPNEHLKVFFNSRNNTLEIMAPPQPRPGYAPETSHVCSHEEVERMYQTLKKESFDKTRMEIAKNIISHNMLTAHQIKRLAETFSFGSGKVEFLKFAYDFCSDQNHYYECLDVLEFSSEKEQVLKYIQSKN